VILTDPSDEPLIDPDLLNLEFGSVQRYLGEGASVGAHAQLSFALDALVVWVDGEIESEVLDQVGEITCITGRSAFGSERSEVCVFDLVLGVVCVGLGSKEQRG